MLSKEITSEFNMDKDTPSFRGLKMMNTSELQILENYSTKLFIGRG
jgi:hypothetical protein